MAKTRMERYFNGGVHKNRYRKNQHLYESDLDEEIISQQVPLEKTIKLSIEELKKMPQTREEYHKLKDYKTGLMLEEEKKEETVMKEGKKVQSLEDLIKKRKEETPTKKRYNTRYNILKELNIDTKYDPEEVEHHDEVDYETKLLTIISEINNGAKEFEQEKREMVVADSEEDLITFSDLEKTKVIKLNEEKKEKEDFDTTTFEIKKDDIEEESGKFFTNTMTFSKEEKEELGYIEESLKKNNRLIRILIFLLILVILSMVVWIFKQYL